MAYPGNPVRNWPCIYIYIFYIFQILTHKKCEEEAPLGNGPYIPISLIYQWLGFKNIISLLTKKKKNIISFDLYEGKKKIILSVASTWPFLIHTTWRIIAEICMISSLTQLTWQNSKTTHYWSSSPIEGAEILKQGKVHQDCVVIINTAPTYLHFVLHLVQFQQ